MYGLRLDSDGEIIWKDGLPYNKFQLQANAGKDVPSGVKRWRDANSTHAVIADLYVKKDGSKEDVEEALEELRKKITGK